MCFPKSHVFIQNQHEKPQNFLSEIFVWNIFVAEHNNFKPEADHFS